MPKIENSTTLYVDKILIGVILKHKYNVVLNKYIGGHEMKKKVLAVLLSATMLAGMLAGCGNSSAPAPEEAAAADEPGAAEDASGGGLRAIPVLMHRVKQ